MTLSTKNDQIRQVIIFPVSIYMVGIQSIHRFTDCTKIRKFSKCVSSIAKFSADKIRIFLSKFRRGSSSRFIEALNGTINTVSSPVKSQYWHLAFPTELEFVRIPKLIRAGNRAKLPLFSFMVGKFHITYLTLGNYMMIKIVTFSRAVKRIKPFCSSNFKGLFAEIANFFHRLTPMTLSTIKP